MALDKIGRPKLHRVGSQCVILHNSLPQLPYDGRGSYCRASFVNELRKLVTVMQGFCILQVAQFKNEVFPLGATESRP